MDKKLRIRQRYEGLYEKKWDMELEKNIFKKALHDGPSANLRLLYICNGENITIVKSDFDFNHPKFHFWHTQVFTRAIRKLTELPQKSCPSQI